MSYMFAHCNNLVTIRTWNRNTSNVTNMRGMFAGCDALSNFYVQFTDTSNVTDMGYMFYSCTALTTLDLSDFNTSSVTNTESMFDGCGNLTTIYATNSFTTVNVPNLKSVYMFTGCSNLVGGNGTHYSNSKTYKEYARIDKSGTPGYFTRS